MSNLLSDLDLAALLCSRVCHDLVSPVGAIANGLEMMDEEDDQELHRLALELVRRSARQASAKLQFCRLAFGAAGGAGSLLDVGEAGDIARLFVAEEKVKLDWLAPRGAARQERGEAPAQSHAAGDCGRAARRQRCDRGHRGRFMSATAVGEGARLADKTKAVLDRAVPAAEFDARAVQVYYALRLAEQAGFTLAASRRGTVISAPLGDSRLTAYCPLPTG